MEIIFGAVFIAVRMAWEAYKEKKADDHAFNVIMQSMELKQKGEHQ